MPITRRHFIKAGIGASVLASAPNLALSEMSLGTARLTTVSDGNLVLPGSFIFERMPKDQLSKVLQAHGIRTQRLTPECNLALYRDGENTVLFDVGSGPDFMPSAGQMINSLEAAGLGPDDISHVLFTHAHPDHIWGLLDDFDEPVFTNARYFMGRHEWDYWWNPETVNSIGEARKIFAVGAKRRMEVIEDQVEFFDDGQEILPSIMAVSSPGHTPGHMSFEIRQSTQSAMIVGDAIGNHHVAFAKPAWHSGSDQDAELAAQTRKILFDRITHEDMALVGFHLPNGGIGRAVKSGDGYKFEGVA